MLWFVNVFYLAAITTIAAWIQGISGGRLSVSKSGAARNPEPVGEPQTGSAAACDATSGGIIQCLHMLAEEAGSLGLACTVRALWVAIAVCEHEAGHAPPLFPPSDPMRPIAPSMN
ncbi:MAG TPA: hypothetical protein VMF62_15585 [Acetobacteraceae bacterium]|nr:hypothetical protein [Acetobacteraceae bacterium]